MSRHLKAGGSEPSCGGWASRQRGGMCKGPRAGPARRPELSGHSLRRFRGKTQGKVCQPPGISLYLACRVEGRNRGLIRVEGMGNEAQGKVRWKWLILRDQVDGFPEEWDLV